MTNKKYSIKSILFDMDGVLVDSMKYHMKSWKELLDIYNVKLSEDFIYEHEGAMDHEVIKNIFSQTGIHLDSEQIEEIYVTQNRLFNEKYIRRVTFYPNALELLRKLSAQGLRLGLVTSSRMNLVNQIWRGETLRFFEAVITSDHTERFKPHPDPYLKALKTVGGEGAHSLVIENAPAGIQSALAAGLTCYAISSTLPKEKLARAHRVFPDLNALSKHLEDLIS
jgi:HAD superfamily hydrolase (TIGR01509 family)